MSEPGRFAPAVCLAFAVFALAGCGYPGEPLPPALNRPNRVVDLSAVERGEKIVIHFTLPAKTTEGLPVKQNPDIELRLGPQENPTRCRQAGGQRRQLRAHPVEAGNLRRIGRVLRLIRTGQMADHAA